MAFLFFWGIIKFAKEDLLTKWFLLGMKIRRYNNIHLSVSDVLQKQTLLHIKLCCELHVYIYYAFAINIKSFTLRILY
jgi:hypothetical protein